MNFIKKTEKNKSNNEELINLLNQYALNTEDPILNFNLAKYYQSIGQRSTAITFYIKCADRTIDKTLQYSSLIAAADCFNIEGCRDFTVTSLIKNALITDPERPEAYFYLSKIFQNKAKATQIPEEQASMWYDAYMYACLGTNIGNKEFTKLYVDNEYPGYYGLLFMKAISSWYCGMAEQTKSLLETLINSYQAVMSDEYKIVIFEHIKRF